MTEFKEKQQVFDTNHTQICRAKEYDAYLRA